jgi:cell division protein FtsW (lipid II flippase)
MRRAPLRRAELGLIVMALVLTAGAYVLASLGSRTSSLPANLAPFLIAVVGLLGAAHVAMRRLAPNADALLLPAAVLLNGLGYVFIARLDKSLAGLQALWTAIGIGAFVATLLLVRRTRDIERYRYTFALLGIGLLLMPLLPVVGRNINGARLWVRFAGITFQPGEMAKIALCIFFASYLVEKRELLSVFTSRIGPVSLPAVRHLGPLVLAWGVSLVVMIAEREIGSSALFFALFVSMLWLTTDRNAYLALGAILFAAGSVFSYKSFHHVQQRVHIWHNPWPTANGSGYQIVQGLFALGAGGLFGVGLSRGNPGHIPAVATDFIFAAIGEELGLFGTAAVILAFLLIVGTGMRIALRAESPFEKLLAAGLTTIIGIQTFIIIGGVTRLVPLTGVTLPFVSYGGSSLLSNYVLLALLLRISDQTTGRAQTLRLEDQETRAE